LAHVPVWLLHRVVGAAGGGALTTAGAVAYQVLVLTPMTFGVMHACLRAARDEVPTVGDVLVPFRGAYGASVLAGLLAASPALLAALLLLAPLTVLFLLFLYVTGAVTSLPALVGAVLLLLLLLVPAVGIAVRLAFVPFLVTDERLGALAAARESWRRSAGHTAAIVGVGLIAGPLLLLGLSLFVVGVVPATLWTTLAFASLYAAVTRPSSGAGAAASEDQ
jgi:hypothetical protein